MPCRAEGVYVCMVCMALMTTTVLRTKPQDWWYVSVNACGARRVLLSTLIHKALVCMYVCMYVCVFMALITTLVLCARSQDLEMSCQCVGYMSVLWTAGFKGGGKPCHKTRETATLRRGIQKTSRT